MCGGTTVSQWRGRMRASRGVSHCAPRIGLLERGRNAMIAVVAAVTVFVATVVCVARGGGGGGGGGGAAC